MTINFIILLFFFLIVFTLTYYLFLVILIIMPKVKVNGWNNPWFASCFMIEQEEKRDNTRLLSIYYDLNKKIDNSLYSRIQLIQTLIWYFVINYRDFIYLTINYKPSKYVDIHSTVNTKFKLTWNWESILFIIIRS